MPSLWRTAQPVIRHPSWWRQMSWNVVVETLSGLMVAWGLAQGLSMETAALGMSVLFFTEAFLLQLAYTRGRWGVFWGGLGLFGLTALASFRWGWSSWWGLCMAVGWIQGLSSAQGIRALAQIPLSARRRQALPSQAMMASSVIAVVVFSVCMSVSGVLTAWWDKMPYVLALGALLFLAPLDWSQVRPLNRAQFHAHHRRLKWWLGISACVNTSSMLGRRFVVPLVLVACSVQWGFSSKSAIAWLGASIGLVGVLGLCIRLWLLPARPLLLSSPFAGTMLGWVLVGLGFVAHTTTQNALWLGVVLAGWVTFEVSHRLWLVAHFDGLRQDAEQLHCNKQKVFRHALYGVMPIRALFSGLAYLVMAFVAPLGVIPVVAVLLLWCAFSCVWFAFRKSLSSPLPLVQ